MSKKRYKTGIHKSLKCLKEIHYRSGWENQVCLWLDWQNDILVYEYEPFAIPYISNKKTNRQRRYFPDFLIEYKDGSKKLLEVKREDKLNQVKTIKKLKCAQQYCIDNNMEFLIWTNNKIKEITKENKILYPPPLKKKRKKRRKPK